MIELDQVLKVRKSKYIESNLTQSIQIVSNQVRKVIKSEIHLLRKDIPKKLQ